jgi:NitT/TauT family transport system substrate-binding protein
MDDPKAAAKVYVEALPAYKGKEDLMERILAMYTELTYKGQATLGMMDEARLAKLQDFYLAQGFIDKKTPINELYTNQFVK